MKLVLVLIMLSKFLYILPQLSSSLILVDLAFILCLFRCLFTVADDSDKCLSTEHSANPGHHIKMPFFIAAIHVDLIGIQHASCRKFINSF
jgi:hypothetical protein